MKVREGSYCKSYRGLLSINFTTKLPFSNGRKEALGGQSPLVLDLGSRKEYLLPLSGAKF